MTPIRVSELSVTYSQLTNEWTCYSYLQKAVTEARKSVNALSDRRD